ncbi:hypothetical protein L596_016198 [Steinernema carpocapsae]|uniref:Uncharacterized protein n=1 Tax=Steinernema carpocapsae TaxID=34508 RepID=A0A4U5NHD7_STECR|nr:hypothetical protein L596_016198 [Steinernema carpocapsae]
MSGMSGNYNFHPAEDRWFPSYATQHIRPVWETILKFSECKSTYSTPSFKSAYFSSSSTSSSSFPCSEKPKTAPPAAPYSTCTTKSSTTRSACSPSQSRTLITAQNFRTSSGPPPAFLTSSTTTIVHGFSFNFPQNQS